MKRFHPVAAFIAFFTILIFWLSTAVVELAGSEAAVVSVKRAIPWGLIILIPAIAFTGASGFKIGGRSADPRIQAKKKRMPLVALNGILVLVPCAFYLAHLAGQADFGQTFRVVQTIELLAGAINLTLMGMSIRDGIGFAREMRGLRTRT